MPPDKNTDYIISTELPLHRWNKQQFKNELDNWKVSENHSGSIKNEMCMRI